MKKLLLILCALVPLFATAAGPSMQLDKANNDLSDKESLKNGFKTYVNYCLGCHQLGYQRYNRTFTDLGIDNADGVENYMYTGEKVGDHITNTMPKKEAASWFGTAPPDLTLEARLRSPDWIYTYLRSFYMDDSRPFGVNNKVFKDVGMPHVLQDLQGVSSLDEHGHMTPAMGGSLTTEEYDVVVRDLTNFLEYVGEPSKLERKSLGYKVLIFLFVFFIIAYFLKREYWKDIH
ncbi:cytochrome c1 [Colwellia sp. 4_MG-2023]|jgi:ubiquinol-cytochrome c reductase cytochrome c1 subunit|uniref:cytochrome c1 n=1 Tax=unclassified Colwellia TaxID=196834 RepID=UPI001C093492|nr:MULTISPECIES: cytochrome c1 [unclassified Colwellia]MBU2926228.1 cytochrome c1 [Colwellia sp. C2M11]MDO6489462.1 cytochrome c1 [Colwellia sp. 6_MG-2023]MDO6508474.1 cytochrome c1 [Colwellia sp. 5_MG-2023]MDO6557089.1 cytochrome c1 [Colwellia sp. 4_MG-2023]MDO6652350.1 cytochrome c1 [Colwellia sp. 3_MG-2023]